jgi:hypothetical protein
MSRIPPGLRLIPDSRYYYVIPPQMKYLVDIPKTPYPYSAKESSTYNHGVYNSIVDKIKKTFGEESEFKQQYTAVALEFVERVPFGTDVLDILQEIQFDVPEIVFDKFENEVVNENIHKIMLAYIHNTKGKCIAHALWGFKKIV